MKLFVAAFALAIATPAAAQTAAQPPADHSQHQGQHQQGQHQGHQQSQGQGQHPEGCPCCHPGPDGRRPACCERMMPQRPQSGGHPGDQGNSHH
jgi:opacity protein-like surface antigen